MAEIAAEDVVLADVPVVGDDCVLDVAGILAGAVEVVGLAGGFGVGVGAHGAVGGDVEDYGVAGFGVGDEALLQGGEDGGAGCVFIEQRVDLM